MRKWIVAAAAALLLTVVNLGIHSRETLVASGRVVLLELAPVDPRSLMQGDYMALRFKVERDAFVRPLAEVQDGRLVVGQDANGVAAFRRVDDGSPLAPDEAWLRFRIRNGVPKFATNAFFFEEGHARDFANARYGEFRVAADGESVLTGLRDANLVSLGKRPNH